MQYYWDAWKNTFIFLLLQLAMCFFIPLIQALFLNELIRLQKCLTTLYILPALIPTSSKRHYMEVDLASGLRRCQSNHQIFRRAAPGLAGDPGLVKFCIIFPGVLGGGLTVLLYLSAIQGVSSDIMESAALDGCTASVKYFGSSCPTFPL